MTTLEWLLVVAAVAGLAALAVVLVQSVVGDTAERVESSDARQTAADLAATDLERRWAAETPSTPEDVKRINRAYGARCRQLGVIYSDISLSVRVHEGTLKDPGGTPADYAVVSMILDGSDPDPLVWAGSAARTP